MNVVIYGYYFLILKLNSNILPYMNNANYITNQDIMLLLAKRIKEYRLAARMSQKEMAEKSGVSLATISHFEQGVNQNMTLNNFISLLRIIGMEQRISDLLPELPMPPMALKKINKLIPKRVRRNDNDTKS
jgi:DNA-binding XRE family transcriptional regulator